MSKTETSEKPKKLVGSSKKVAKKVEAEKVVKLTEEEYEKRVLELGKTLTSERIGEKLRKEHIHPKDYKKRISQILKSKNQYVNSDLKNIEKKLNTLRSHFEKNKQDKRAKRDLVRTQSKLRRLRIYFKEI